MTTIETGNESAPILDVAGLRASYGNARVLFGVDFSLPPATSLALLGSNGAGKSTTARSISGLIPSQAGSRTFCGRDISGLRPHAIRRLGLTYLPEGRGIFFGLLVAENLRMAVRWLKNRSDRNEAMERAYSLFPILYTRRSLRAGSLSGGEQQMLSVASGLATSPKLLIADELSLGLSPAAYDLVLSRLVDAKKEGVAIILIEQYVHRALEFAEECVILNQGSVAWKGRSSAVKDDILDRYLGQD